MKTELYRHYDKNGRLLYVGISNCAVSRADSHSDKAEWFGDATKMTVEQFDSREAASAAEASAVINERPAFNIRHKARFVAKKKYPTVTFRPSAKAAALLSVSIKEGTSQSSIINDCIVSHLSNRNLA